MSDDEPAVAEGGWSTTRVRLALAAAALVLLLGTPFWGPLLLRQLSFFKVRKVEIIGARYVPIQEVMARLRVDTTASVWDPTQPLVARLASHPQLRNVTIRRKLPGTLVVELQENPPVALVATSDGLRAYDARGIALPIDLAKTPIDAPILGGRDVGLLHFLGALRDEAPALYDRVSDVRIVASDEVLLQVAGTPVRAMHDVSPARLAEIEPVEHD